MNDKHKEWLEVYIESGDARKATTTVYTEVQGNSIATKTSYLKSTLAQEIDNHAREQYKKETPLMLNVIKEIALNCEQPAVKLKAADTWLSRAGHDAALVVETKNATQEELLQRLKIAATGIDPILLEQVLGKSLSNTISPMEEDNGIKH